MEGDQKYWFCLGDLCGGGKYPKTVTDDPKWRDSWIRDEFTTSIFEVTFNPRTGGASVTVEKNTARKEPHQ